MEITSPNSLWKDYDVSALPLNISYLSEKKEGDAVVKELYFDGYITVDGRTRAYLKISEHPSPKGVILYLSHSDGGVNDALIGKLFDFGYTVAVLDYLGKSDFYPRFTIYQRSLSHCNCRGEKEFEAREDAKSSQWYIWTCLARRAIKLLRETYDKNIFALGVGLGGNTVYKLSVFDDGLTACATLLNIIPAVVGSGNAIINYHASLENSAYAPFCRVPMFTAVSSNDEDGSLDDMSVLANNTGSLKAFRIVERAFAGGIKTVYSDIDRFFSGCADSSIDLLDIKLTAANSDGNLYFNISTNGDEQESENLNPKLFVAFCSCDPPFRNWMKIPVISLDGSKFMAHINVCQDNKPIDAFINFTNKNGIMQSSALLTVIPKNLGIKGREGVNHRKIYDGSMGEDGWTSRDGGNVSLVQGPFGIDGITCDSKSLISFKPGDPLFKVPADTLLQIMASGEPQTLCVTVSDKNNSYSCQVEIKNAEDWHKFSLSHINFKGANGPLSDWSNILTLEFYSEKQFIIGSVLWV